MRKNVVARLRWWLAWLCVGSAMACIPEIATQETPRVSGSTLALFAPDTGDACQSVLPFPSDLAKDPQTHRLNIPFCLDDDPTTLSIKQGLRTLDGYSVNPIMYAPMSGPVDVTTTTDSVFVVDLSSGETVDFAPVYDPSNNRLFIFPTVAIGLRPSNPYLVVVTTGLKDANDQGIVSDQVFTFAKSREPLVDELGHSRFAALDDANAYALEGLRQAFAPMFAAIEDTVGFVREDVAVAWTFTTQEARTVLEQMDAAANARGGAAAFHETVIPAEDHPLLAAAGIPTSNLCDVHAGHIALQNFVTPEGTLAPPGADVSSTVVADYVLVTPRVAGNCPVWDGAKVAVFAHGLSRCKNDAVALADTLAQGGFATLAVDGPRAGGRSVNALGDQNLDGCPDQPETPEFIGLSDTNPFGVRDQLRQWGVELAQVVDAAAADVGSFANLEPTPATQVVLVGHSWGGMASVLAASLTNSVDALAVNAASAELGRVFEPSIRAQVVAAFEDVGVDTTVEPGLSMVNTQVTQTVPTFRWILEPGDPLLALEHLPSSLPVLTQIVSAGAGDVEDAALHGTAGQEKLASQFNATGMSDVTYVMLYDSGGADVSICDESSGIVGSILQPCTTDAVPAASVAALAKLAAMRSQLMFFLATGSVCGDNRDVACP